MKNNRSIIVGPFVAWRERCRESPARHRNRGRSRHFDQAVQLADLIRHFDQAAQLVDLVLAGLDLVHFGLDLVSLVEHLH